MRFAEYIYEIRLRLQRRIESDTSLCRDSSPPRGHWGVKDGLKRKAQTLRRQQPKELFTSTKTDRHQRKDSA